VTARQLFPQDDALAAAPASGAGRPQLLLADAGAEGDSGLQQPGGSLFSFTAGAAPAPDGSVDWARGTLRPLLLRRLAGPSALAVAVDGGEGVLQPVGPDGQVAGRAVEGSAVVFLAETMANRILRLREGPPGVFAATSVFLQLRGRLGPTALALAPKAALSSSRARPPRQCRCRRRGGLALFIAHSEAAGSLPGAVLRVCAACGDEEDEEWEIPGPRISGLLLLPAAAGAGGAGRTLLVTEESSGALLSLSV